MNEQSKKQNELRVEDEFEQQYEDSLKILFRKLNELIVDAASLDVFIVKGNYLIKEVGDTDSLDFIKFLAEQKPINCEILARTQIQISGDCATVLPASGVGELSQKDIIEYHKQQVEIAQRTYKERIEFVRALIRQIIDYIRSRT
jgi:hypothetical protein